MPNGKKLNGNAWLLVVPVLGVMAGFIAGNRSVSAEALRTACVVEERESNHHAEVMRELERASTERAEIKELLKER